jgi:transcription elongation factor
MKPGSAVRIVAGEQAGMVGKLDDISHGVACVLPDHDKHGAVQVPISALCLYLHVGDYIRVSAGENVGRKGWITEIESKDGMDVVTFTDDTLDIPEEVSPS